MAWYEEAVFYHIYPLGLTGAPRQNDYSEPVHRLNTLLPWIDHLKELGFTALYIGPLFQSVGHGYETTDYRLLDSRLGTNEDLTNFVAACHKAGLKVIFDGVFNHTGRDFFAFRDIREKRESSPYRDWYCNVNFGGNNEYNDGFSYDNWGGYNLLVKLNQRNPAVVDYILDVVRFWVSEFDVDGIRLDAADVLDFDFMKALRRTGDEIKQDFWLMGEVIHGDYSRWANAQTLHSVTDYTLHKALYSGHNDHNYFEIAHTVQRNNGMVPANVKLYNFVDNHDVNRIMSKLMNKAHYLPVHILLYTLPGIPSVYYGSEFGIEGCKEQYSDAPLRPYIDLNEYKNAVKDNPCTALIASLGKIHSDWKNELVYGDYRQLYLTNQQFGFARGRLIVAVNNGDGEAYVSIDASEGAYIGLLSGKHCENAGGRLNICLDGCSGDIFVPDDGTVRVEEDKKEASAELKKESVNEAASAETEKEPVTEASAEPAKESAAEAASAETEKDPVTEAAAEPEKDPVTEAAPEPKKESVAEAASAEPKKESAAGASADPAKAGTKAQDTKSAESEGKKTVLEEVEIPDIPYDLMTVEQLQAVILSKMAKNGPVTAQMRKDVTDNIWHNSLVNWANSFR